jgi:hypothetical protein
VLALVHDRHDARYDREHGDAVSACKFRFRRPAGDKWKRYTLESEPRSL